MIKLIGILVIAVGFALRFNTLLVVMGAGVVTGLVAGMSFNEIIGQFGKFFVENRYMTLPVVLIAPVIGLLERYGLQERAEILIKRATAATAGRVLLLYTAVRQISISLGVNIGGHAQAVRPLVAPMAEGAARAKHGALPPKTVETIRRSRPGGRSCPPRATTIARGERMAEAERLKNRIFWPALLIPATAVVGTLVLGRIHVGPLWLSDTKNVTLIALGFGAVLALSAAVHVTGASGAVPAREGGRLLQSIGWALILPQMLAALGGIFAQAGVGAVVADLVAKSLPTQFPFVAVASYCVGMVVFTMCMGNAFAAFAVITGGIGLPLIVQQHHGNPAIMAAIGMLSGYCGTLMTPMAATFNIVPAMLLELRDQNAVIKAQLPMALTILAANILLMWLCVYRF